MRDLDKPEPAPQLGDVVKAPESPQPADVKITERIMRRPDGTLYTVSNPSDILLP